MVPAKFEANEHIRRKQVELGFADDEKLPFLCECDDVACRDIVQLTAAEYRAARADGARGIVAAGHRYTPDMDERARRIGENEALYRSINEKIGDLNDTFGLVAESMAVICECGYLECTEQIELDVPTYEHVRSDPAWFVVLPGHQIPEVETVLEDHESFLVIKKDEGGPAELARELAER